jgi:hypothetical protein
MQDKKYEFKLINRWPRTHLRNILICTYVASGKTYEEVAKDYSMTNGNVCLIYKGMMALLCKQIFNVSFEEAFHNRKWNRHLDARNILRQYKEFYEKESK